MNKIKLSASLLSALFIVACGGAPKKVDSLESARSAYSAASNNEFVVRHASTELDDARSALARADKNWKNEGKRSRTEHYAYVASQKVKVAELIAQRKQDDARLESMNIKRQQVQLDVRAQEVELERQKTLEMQQQLEDMQAQITARGIVATLGDVLFDSGEAGLKETAAVNIERIAKFMRQYPERTAIVEGHTDNMGDDDYNLDLSRTRAHSVRSALMARGIDGSRISTVSVGEAVPVADNNTSEGRRKNRRVEVIFPDLETQISEYDGQ